MLFLRLLLILLFFIFFAHCQEINRVTNFSSINFKELPTTVDDIKLYWEKEINDYVENEFEYFLDYGMPHNIDSCNETNDAKSCCYCSIYLANFAFKEQFETDIESFHWTTIDLHCPISYPVRRNLNYFRLKQRFLKNLSSLHLDENYITNVCSQTKR